MTNLGSHKSINSTKRILTIKSKILLLPNDDDDDDDDDEEEDLSKGTGFLGTTIFFCLV
jgi:hypothetical protein